MQIDPLAIPGLVLLTPRRLWNEHGVTCETWNADTLSSAGLGAAFVQEHVTRTRDKGTLRGLYFQRPPRAQAVLVRVVRGAILCVAVDLRRDSPSFGQHAAVVLSADNWQQLWVPVGLAHGTCTLETDTEIVGKVTSPDAPDLRLGIAFDDPVLGIPWPVDRTAAILSDKDRELPPLSQIESPFS